VNEDKKHINANSLKHHNDIVQVKFASTIKWGNYGQSHLPWRFDCYHQEQTAV